MFITLIFCYFFINQEELQNFLIPQMEINGRRKLRIVRYQIYCKLNSLVENRGSIFEKCYPISLPLAHKMLVFSYKFPSSFSQWDPIKVKKIYIYESVPNNTDNTNKNDVGCSKYNSSYLFPWKIQQLQRAQEHYLIE